jgi:hypothetical protein
VGYSGMSQAKYFIESRGEVLPLLEQLIQVSAKPN